MSNFRDIKRMLRYLGIRSRKIKELKREMKYWENENTFNITNIEMLNKKNNELKEQYEKEIENLKKEHEKNEKELQKEIKIKQEQIEYLEKSKNEWIEYYEENINEQFQLIKYIAKMLDNRIKHDECIPILLKEYNILVHNIKCKERAKSTYTSLKMSKWIINAERIIDENIKKINELNYKYNEIDTNLETYLKQITHKNENTTENQSNTEQIGIKTQLKTYRQSMDEKTKRR